MSEKEEKLQEEIQNDKKTDVFEGYDPSVKIRTKKMLMYLIIFAIVMIFAGLTSAYIVVNANKFWVHVDAPSWLIISCVVIALSSATLYGAYRVAKNGNQQLTTVLILITLGLGLFFTYAQIEGWEQLSEKGMGFTIEEVDGVMISNWNRIADIQGEYGVDYYVHKNGEQLVLDDGEFYMPDDQFKTTPVTNQVEKTSNLNGSFIAVLIFVHLTHLAFGLIYLMVLAYRSIVGKISKENNISLYTGGLYWHFLGILWIYLFVFLFFIH